MHVKFYMVKKLILIKYSCTCIVGLHHTDLHPGYKLLAHPACMGDLHLPSCYCVYHCLHRHHIQETPIYDGTGMNTSTTISH